MDHYAVIGNPVGHSRSPWIHQRFAHDTEQSLTYNARLAPIDGFQESVNLFQTDGGKGLNVTVPFKQEAFHLATQHSERAQLAEAVNTLIWTGTHWRGDNTDGIGLCRDLLQCGFMVPGKRIVILGAGGAVQGLLPVLLEQQPLSVYILNRTVSRAQALVDRMQPLAPHTPLKALAWDANIAEPVDGIIQATSTALLTSTASHESVTTPNEDPFQSLKFSCNPDAWCYDLVYGQAAKVTAQWAASRQLRFADGLGMLVEQAAESFWLWRNIRPETRQVLSDLRKLI
ncbi:MAG: shikimate dehydrogenase [Pseudomonadota bacterium]